MPLPARGSKEDLTLRDKFAFSGSEEDAKFVADWIGKLILYGVSQAGMSNYFPCRCGVMD